MIGQTLALLLMTNDSSKVDIPFQLESQYPVVAFTNEKGGGEKYILSLSATRNATFVDDARCEMEVSQRTLRIGVRSYKLEFTTRERFVNDKAIKGVIGLDFFKSNPVGFDFGKNVLYLWTNESTDDDFQQWATSLKSWNYLGKSSYKLVPIPFSSKLSPVAGIEVMLGGKPLQAILASAKSGNAIEDSSRPANSPVLNVGMGDSTIIDGFGLIGSKLAVIEAVVGRHLSVPGLPASVDLRLALGSLNSRLTILDYPRQRLWVEDLPKHAANSLFLSRALGFPVYVEAGMLKLGALRNSLSIAARYEGSTVEFVGGVRMSTLLDALAIKNKESLKKLADLLNLASKASRVTLRFPGGKTNVSIHHLTDD